MAVKSLRRLRTIQEGWRLAALIDVETTGLHRYADEVVELAVLLFAYDPAAGVIQGVVDEYVGLRDPRMPIPAAATNVHGIRDKDVSGKRLDDRYVRRLMQRADFIIAHNCTFDQAFVERLYPDMKGKPWLCSMNGVPWRQMGFASRGLQNLLRDHRISVSGAHRGGHDARNTLRLIAGHDKDGVPYFKHMLVRYADRLAKVATRPVASTTDFESMPSKSVGGTRWLFRVLWGIVRRIFALVWSMCRLPFRLLQRVFSRS